jgi:hypothetical protein
MYRQNKFAKLAILALTTGSLLRGAFWPSESLFFVFFHRLFFTEAPLL